MLMLWRGPTRCAAERCSAAQLTKKSRQRTAEYDLILPDESIQQTVSSGLLVEKSVIPSERNEMISGNSLSFMRRWRKNEELDEEEYGEFVSTCSTIKDVHVRVSLKQFVLMVDNYYSSFQFGSWIQRVLTAPAFTRGVTQRYEYCSFGTA